LLPGNYIVRIYRRGKDDTRLVVGIVEEVGVREKKGFHCIEELRIILDLPPGRPIRQPRNGGNGGNVGAGKTDETGTVRAGRKGNGEKERKG
jgi:hypothetical protein